MPSCVLIGKKESLESKKPKRSRKKRQRNKLEQKCFISFVKIFLLIYVELAFGALFFCFEILISYFNGFLTTTITESPLRNIFEIKRSFGTGLALACPFPVFGTSVHNSRTFSRTMLQ